MQEWTGLGRAVVMDFLLCDRESAPSRTVFERAILTSADRRLRFASSRYCCGLKQGAGCARAKETGAPYPSSCVLEA